MFVFLAVLEAAEDHRALRPALQGTCVHQSWVFLSFLQHFYAQTLLCVVLTGLVVLFYRLTVPGRHPQPPDRQEVN